MTTEDFKQLEGLLGKLETFFGSRYEIFPWAMGKGARIMLFDNDGQAGEDAYGQDLETVAKELKQK